MTRSLITLLLVSIAASACSLSPYKIMEVDSRVKAVRENGMTCFPRESGRCADPSSLLELGRADIRSGRHHVTLIEFGEDALKLRIHLVRAARDTIDVQNFILRRDDTGELFLNELLDAARRGVKIRLLLDQMFTFSDLEYLVLLAMDHANFEIRFYNPTFNKAKMSNGDWLSGMACCFRRVNQRMHNKLMVVDDLVGVTGGRNIADRYFDYDTNYEFKDRDILVYGRIAEEMRESFDWFWEYEKSVPVQHLRDVANELLNGREFTLEPFQPADRLLPLLRDIEDVQHLSLLFVSPAHEVSRIEYFSDKPRKAEFPEDSRKQDITTEIHDVLSSARKSVVVQSPYMVLSKRARKVFKQLRKDNPEIELVFSTNSLASTDADTVYAHTHKHKKHYVKTLGFKMYEFKPYPVDAPLFFPRWSELIKEKEQGISSKSVVSGDNSTIAMPAPRSGLHAKSFVVDGWVAMIGSHNFDPRSEGFNTENCLVIWDKAFAGELEGLIRRDTEPQNSWVVALKPDQNEVGSVIESVSRTLPVFDLWPFHSTSVYELLPGGTPALPGTSEFYENYHSVGRFPDVTRTRRQVTVMFLSSFFGFIAPVL
jgi:putative cardiolipin synthase